jgi:hypothetical protein
VHATLDDLVIARYVTIDELLEPRRGPGHPPKLADSELICLAVAQVLLGYRSERRWLRAVNTRLGHLFPYVCGQAAYNRRLRRAAPLVNVERELHDREVVAPEDIWGADAEGPSAAAGQGLAVTIARSSLGSRLLEPISGRWAAIGGIAWVVLLGIGIAVEPPPTNPNAIDPGLSMPSAASCWPR